VALQFNDSLRFHPINNEELIAYSKADEESENIVIIVVNLDPYHTQAGWLDLPVHSFGIDKQQTYQVHDLLTDTRHLWHGERNYVQLDPARTPAHIFRLRRRLRREQDFEYFF
jgi:starch synthase (maltosyl-transferring)